MTEILQHPGTPETPSW